MMLRRWLVVAAMTAAIAPAQSARPRDVGLGKLLVASKDLKDPNFAKTVILIVKYDDDGVVGLIINRQSSVPLSRAFGDLKEAKGHTDPLYAGGPVERKSVLALLRSKEKVQEAERVFSDVNLVSNQALLEKTLASGADASRFRVYVGYAGWTVSQLANEIELGAWHIFPGDASLVFDANPDGLWLRMIGKTEVGIASVKADVGFWILDVGKSGSEPDVGCRILDVGKTASERPRGFFDSLAERAQNAGQGFGSAVGFVPSRGFGGFTDSG